MALSTAGLNEAADGVAAAVTHISLHDDDPGATGANELTGGSPAYARQAVAWGAAASGVATMTGTETFDIPAGSTVSHFGLWTASSGGTFLGGGALSASEVYGAQGTYTLSTATISVT